MLSAVEDLFSVRCHTDLTKSAETFESLSTGYSHVYGGNVIINRYPMCGRKSLQNPRYIYNSASAPVGFAESTNRYVSFTLHWLYAAYKCFYNIFWLNLNYKQFVFINRGFDVHFDIAYQCYCVFYLFSFALVIPDL